MSSGVGLCVGVVFFLKKKSLVTSPKGKGLRRGRLRGWLRDRGGEGAALGAVEITLLRFAGKMAKFTSSEVGGFVGWIASFLAFFAYVAWCLCSAESLESIGVTYYPDRCALELFPLSLSLDAPF